MELLEEGRREHPWGRRWGCGGEAEGGRGDHSGIGAAVAGKRGGAARARPPGGGGSRGGEGGRGVQARGGCGEWGVGERR